MNKVNLTGEDAFLYEYILDNFKGICELNNYNLVIGFCGNLDKTYNYDFEVNVLNKNSLTKAEIINLGVKYLYILGFDFVKVYLKKSDKELLDNLNALEIEHEIKNISSYGELCIKGRKENKEYKLGIISESEGINIKFNYIEIINAIKDSEIFVKKNGLDIYVYSTDKESISDALIIGSMLKDAGYKTEIEYTLDKKDIDSSFRVEVSNKYSSKYSVKLIDVKTKEENIVDINNLVETLDMKY